MLPVQELVAAFLIGTAMNLVLFGVTVCQYAEYYRSARDGWVYRVAAAFVFLVGTLHTCFAFHSTWSYTVDSLVTPTVFASSPWSFAADPLVTSCVAVVVQLSYAHRIFIISKRSPWLPGFIIVLTAVSLAWGVLDTYFAASNALWSSINTKKPHVATWLGALTASDIVITASLTYYLRKSRTDFEETNSLLDRIIRLTVQNNGLTSAAAITSAVLFAIDSTFHLVPGLVLIKLYQISFFSALNSRRRIAADLSTARISPHSAHTGKGGLHLNTAVSDFSALPTTTTTHTSKRSHHGSRPGFLRSLSAGDVRSKNSWRDHGGDSLPVQVVVESTTVEDRVPDETWDAEKLMDVSRPPSPASEASEAIPSRRPSTVDLRIAPFLAVPPQTQLHGGRRRHDMADVAAFLGPWLLVTFAEVALLGVNWQQLLVYHKESAPTDRLFLRLLVAVVFVITTVHTGCSIRTVWHYGVVCFGDQTRFAYTTWSFSLDPALTSVVALIVQLNYAWKIWTLSERRARAFPLAIAFFSFFQMAWGIWCTWGMFDLKLWWLARQKRWAVACYLAGMAAADMLIAVSFTYYLRKARGSFAETNRLIDQIVGLTVANNAFTAVVAVTAAVLFGTNSQGWQIGGLVARLYCVSFYSALNARSGLQRQFEEARLKRQNDLDTIPLSSTTAVGALAGPLTANVHLHGAGGANGGGGEGAMAMAMARRAPLPSLPTSKSSLAEEAV
ncbi:hypothetical protein JCM6882_007474 [Rhodosporidiobolus microsporus]